MHIDPDWRVLTVGDGDLSFSLALIQNLRPRHLVASVLDSEQALDAKYDSHKLRQLQGLGVPVLTEFDVTTPDSWQSLPRQAFDLVIFQFPLIPAVGSAHAFTQGPSTNTRNRALLHDFLRHSVEYFLDPNGAGLAYISSKEVKPYIEWDMERALSMGLPIQYLGKHAFDFDDFPGYRIRNVDRDKHVKHTLAYTHVWSRQNTTWPSQAAPLELPVYESGCGCDICRAGPFASEQEAQGHKAGKRHQRMAECHRQWLAYLEAEAKG